LVDLEAEKIAGLGAILVGKANAVGARELGDAVGDLD